MITVKSEDVTMMLDAIDAFELKELAHKREHDNCDSVKKQQKAINDSLKVENHNLELESSGKSERIGENKKDQKVLTDKMEARKERNTFIQVLGTIGLILLALL